MKITIETGEVVDFCKFAVCNDPKVSENYKSGSIEKRFLKVYPCSEPRYNAEDKEHILFLSDDGKVHKKFAITTHDTKEQAETSARTGNRYIITKLMERMEGLGFEFFQNNTTKK